MRFLRILPLVKLGVISLFGKSRTVPFGCAAPRQAESPAWGGKGPFGAAQDKPALALPREEGKQVPRLRPDCRRDFARNDSRG